LTKFDQEILTIYHIDALLTFLLDLAYFHLAMGQNQILSKLTYMDMSTMVSTQYEKYSKRYEQK
jgi:bacteriorhodopsin